MPSPPPPPTIEILSTHTVKPPPNSSHARLCHLTPWDVAMLCPHYIQKGLLFTNLPPSLPIPLLLLHLRTSLSTTLHHFPHLAGRLLTEKHLAAGDDKPPSLHVSIDCNDDGAEFIHAAAGKITPFEFLSPGGDIPSFVDSFFPLNGAINHDGHSAPLLSVQLTELAAGGGTAGAAFLACSFNHVVGDGTSYWNFFNAWAEIARTGALSLPPVHARWFIDGESPPVELPFSDSSQFVERFSPPVFRQRFFHFSAASMANLKERANREINNLIKISSFQALSAMIWRAITRARGLPPEQPTRCRLAIENRGRLRPAHSPAYFGNSIYAVAAAAAAGELEAKGLGWAAGELNRAVAGHTDEGIRRNLREYHAAPIVYKLTMFDPKSVMVGSSPRFDMYGCDFGWGKAAAVRCGPANKFDGKVSAFPGREGGGSVDLEICLLPPFMEVLLGDPEFLDAVSPDEFFQDF